MIVDFSHTARCGNAILALVRRFSSSAWLSITLSDDPIRCGKATLSHILLRKVTVAYKLFSVYCSKYSHRQIHGAPLNSSGVGGVGGAIAATGRVLSRRGSSALHGSRRDKGARCSRPGTGAPRPKRGSGRFRGLVLSLQWRRDGPCWGTGTVAFSTFAPEIRHHGIYSVNGAYRTERDRTE